jgi:hypothetical protein
MSGKKLVRSLLSLADAELRQASAEDMLLTYEPAHLADALDELSQLAEAFDMAAREALLAVVFAMNQPRCAAAVQKLREEAAGRGLAWLERLLRVRAVRVASREAEEEDEARVPDYGAGRTLTLGERKSLARKPDRDTIERLLLDPHPDVIRRVLANPRLTEDHVLRLAARRPCPGAVLAEIARSTRWSGRSRVRLALVLNPSVPEDISVRLVSLLLRQELALVASRVPLDSPVYALCNERLRAAPPKAEPARLVPEGRTPAIDPKLVN